MKSLHLSYQPWFVDQIWSKRMQRSESLQCIQSPNWSLFCWANNKKKVLKEWRMNLQRFKTMSEYCQLQFELFTSSCKKINTCIMWIWAMAKPPKIIHRKHDCVGIYRHFTEQPFILKNNQPKSKERLMQIEQPKTPNELSLLQNKTSHCCS